MKEYRRKCGADSTTRAHEWRTGQLLWKQQALGILECDI
jgi:hypothetical protein